MITTNKEILRQVSKDTTIEECKEQNIFPILEQVLINHSEPGYGICAIQLEIPLRASIIRYKDELSLNMMNPVIEEMDDLQKFESEGCLSIPGVRVDTERYAEVTVSWLDYDIGEKRQATFSGAEAVIMQHEVDHMNGVLCIDRRVKKVVKIGRNEPCPCGSGKKYKKCCGR